MNVFTVNFWFHHSLPKTHNFISCLYLHSTALSLSYHCFIWAYYCFIWAYMGLKEKNSSYYLFSLYLIIFLFGLIWFKFLKDKHITHGHISYLLWFTKRFYVGKKSKSGGQKWKKYVLLADSDSKISLAEYVCGAVAIRTYLGDKAQRQRVVGL